MARCEQRSGNTLTVSFRSHSLDQDYDNTNFIISDIQGFIVGAYITGGVLFTTNMVQVVVNFASGSTYVANCFLSVGQTSVSGSSSSSSPSVVITSSNLTVTPTSENTIDIELPALVSAGTYLNISSITVDANGRILAIGNTVVNSPTFQFFIGGWHG